MITVTWSMDNIWYIYRHIRNDINQVFYIGIGKTKNFKRAYSKSNRNNHWKNTANLGYSIEILIQNLSKEEATELEIFLISLYGRRDLGFGTLVNLTDGGDGTANIIVSETTRKKQSEQRLGEKNGFYGKKHSVKSIQLMRSKLIGLKHSKQSVANMKAARGRFFSKGGILNMKSRVGNLNPNAKIVLDTKTGIFFETVKEASFAYNIKYSTLKSYLQGFRENKTNLIYC